MVRFEIASDLKTVDMHVDGHLGIMPLFQKNGGYEIQGYVSASKSIILTTRLQVDGVTTSDVVWSAYIHVCIWLDSCHF